MQALIVIPCLNEEAYLEKLVDNLLCSCSAETTKIIIADGGSTDRTPQIADRLAQRHSHVAYLHNPQKLQAAALNLAVASYGAQADFVIRIDAHADYPADYVQVLLHEALRTGADSVVVSMQTAGKTPFQKAVAAAQNARLGNGGSAHRLAGENGQWVDHGHHALMRVAAFRAVGGYDETFAHNEDAELDYRLMQAGYKIWLTGRTSLIYYPRAAPYPLFRQYIGYGYGRGRTILKHRQALKLRQTLPACILPMILLALVTPWVPFVAVPMLLWVMLCLGYGVALAVRAHERSIALAGPAALLMHAGWSIGFWRAALSALGK